MTHTLSEVCSLGACVMLSFFFYLLLLVLNSIVDSKSSNGLSNFWSICLEGLRNNVDGVLWSWATSIFY